MNPFKTRLDGVLTLRRRQEHVALELYARSSLASRQAIAELAAVQHEADALSHRRNTSMAAGVKAAQFTQWESYSTTLQAKRTVADRVVADTTRALNQSSKEMMRTRQKREVIEKWIERRRQRHQTFLLHAEQKRIDEMAQRSRMAAPALVRQA